MMAIPLGLRRLPAFLRTHNSVRCFNHLSVTSDADSKVAVLSMGRKPVNSMNLDFLTEMTIALEKLESDRQINGLIVTSSLPRVFSAGLDITEMLNPDPDRLGRFWRTLQDVWIKLYGSGLVTIAAINGNSPAGGCLLSLMCDLRIMAEGKYRIGLNETQVGLAPPFWIQETMINTVGHREAEKALTLGHLFTTEEALRKNLVDQLVPEDKLMETARTEMKRWLQIPDAARLIQKQQLRGSTIHKLLARREQDIQDFVEFTTAPSNQAVIQHYLNSLKQKAK